MDWLDRLRGLKAKSDLTTKEISIKSKIPEPTLEKIFAGKTKNPGINTMQQLVHALGGTLDDIDGGNHSGGKDLHIKKSSSDSELSEEAIKVAKDYSELDQPGKNVVKVVIAEEGKRVVAERERRQVEPAEPKETRYIPLYYTPAAAGHTSPAEGEDYDYIEVGREVPWNADFAVKIDGDSMEPYIRDGAIAYVNREPLVNGDVGIWCVDGDMICKQYYKDDHGNVYLLSLNRDRKDADRFIPHKDTDTVVAYYGRVILPRRPMISLL